MAAAREEDGQLRPQPVFCLMRTAVMESLVRFTHDGGRKIDAWTALHKTVIVPFDARATIRSAFFNANTLAELHQLERHEDDLAQIAAQLQGYDPQALSADAVNDFLARLVAPVAGTEQVGIFDALDRVLAQDIVSPLSVPPHDNSAMDGYAFDGAQLKPAEPLTLEVVGTALAGKAWQGRSARASA